MTIKHLFASTLLWAGLSLSPLHAIEIRTFDDPAKAQRYETLIQKLRCLVCQNQSLADSDADLARDLRGEVYDKIQAGEDEEETLKFLTDRYGDFVLYDPPVKGITLLLWCGPLALLLAGAILAFRHYRKHQLDLTPTPLPASDKERLETIRRQLEKTQET